MTATRSLATLLAALCWASVGLAQDPPKEDAEKKDAALERLLEKIDAKADDAKSDEKQADEKKADGQKPAGEARADDSKPAGEGEAKKEAAEPEDKALDSLLEKIGEQDGAPPPPRRSAAPSPPKEGKEKPEPGKLTGESGKLDEHLEEILGRKKKPKDQQQQQQGQGQGGGGKLGEAIDKMDEVTKRLSKTDTGDQTRKKQGEIVKDLESILKQLRQQAGSGRGRMSRAVRQAGNQNGQQPGQQTGDNAGGAPPMPPRTPPDIHSIVGDKSEWGHLPPELRTELDNIFKEEMLQSQRELIERYFLSLKKDRNRKE